MTGIVQLDPPPLEIWGGVECSVVRLRRGTDDQLQRSGHRTRLDDLNRFADLGLKTLRCPVLWEHHGTTPIDWSLSDACFERMRRLGIRPIAGLLHHGCGPLRGGFLDPEFIPGLERFAGQVAARYPWIDAYTPINEPLTTARFSGLYGAWHPFSTDGPAFARIFMNQAHAIRRAMRAVRAINPAAHLVQTEDVGKTHGTPGVREQVQFDNERRWLTFDLLCGRLNAGDLLHEYLCGCGVDPGELESFRDDPVTPDLLGMNHYVTSERFLDEHVERYPSCHHGGNGRVAYADVPAVRVRTEGAAGPENLLREMWLRYRRPMAITEVHLACTRDEQLRWLQEMWQAARQLRKEGADVRAVTAWALLGAYDWDSLLVQANDHYESGAFDLSGGARRPTAIASALRALASRGEFDHPAAHGPGWWRRAPRFVHPPVSAPETGPGTAVWGAEETRTPLVIVGEDSRLAAEFQRACEERHLRVRLETRPVSPTWTEACEASPPWAVIDLSAGASPFVREALPHPLSTSDPGEMRRRVHAILDKTIDAACR
jgi:dTDP-4-dehydrorhamnose reductase